jgi:heme/copper-type cytochrome/quinol oxidase subunit 1
MHTPTSTHSRGRGLQNAGRALPEFHLWHCSWLLTTDHKRIALLYLLPSPFLFVGGMFATIIRIHLMTPQGFLVTPETYNKLFTRMAWP